MLLDTRSSCNSTCILLNVGYFLIKKKKKNRGSSDNTEKWHWKNAKILNGKNGCRSAQTKQKLTSDSREVKIPPKIQNRFISPVTTLSPLLNRESKLTPNLRLLENLLEHHFVLYGVRRSDLSLMTFTLGQAFAGHALSCSRPIMCLNCRGIL